MIRTAISLALMLIGPQVFAQASRAPQEGVAQPRSPTLNLRAVEEPQSQAKVWIGLSLRQRTDGPVRLEVVEVLPDSPAAAAGIQAGDKLVSIAGVVVASQGALLDALGDRRPGQELHLTLERSRTATLGKSEDDGKQALLGVRIQESSNAAKGAPGVAGVPVVELVEGGAAQACGLRVGERISAIDGVEVHSMEELRRAVLSHSPGESVELRLQLDEALTLAPRPEQDSVARSMQGLGSIAQPSPHQPDPSTHSATGQRGWAWTPPAGLEPGAPPPPPPGFGQAGPGGDAPTLDHLFAERPEGRRGGSFDRAPRTGQRVQADDAAATQMLLEEIRELRRAVAELRVQIESLSRR